MATETKPKRGIRGRVIILRNGLPSTTRNVAITLRILGIRCRRNLIWPLPLPPGDPQIHRTAERAATIIARTERISRRLRSSILTDYIRTHHPELAPLLNEADYQIKRLGRK